MYLNPNERKSLIQHAVKTWGHKLAIVGNPWPERKGFDNTIDAFAVGMDAALLIVPWYLGKEETIRHVMKGLECGPSILVSSMIKDGPIPSYVLDEVKSHKNFIGVRE